MVEYQWLSVYNPIPSLVKVLEARFSEHPPLVDPLPQLEHHRFQHLLLPRGGSGREVYCTKAREGATKITGCEHCRRELACLLIVKPTMEIVLFSLAWRLVLTGTM